MDVLAVVIIPSVVRAAWLVGFFDEGDVHAPTPSCGNGSGKIRKLMKVIVLMVVLMTTFATVGHTAEPVELHTQLIAEVRESIGSRERPVFRMVPAQRLSQGQVVHYTVRITNPTPVFANRVAVSQMIPVNTTYVPGSAVGPGADIEFSIDGGFTFAPAENLKLADGSSLAPPERYTHIRWLMRNPLAPNAMALARFRATFN